MLMTAGAAVVISRAISTEHSGFSRASSRHFRRQGGPPTGSDADPGPPAIVGGPCDTCRDQSPATRFVPHLQGLHVRALNRIAVLVREATSQCAPPGHGDIDALECLALGELEPRPVGGAKGRGCDGTTNSIAGCSTPG
jgi:hypothetical protein